MRKFILGIDEGTTSARSVLYDIDNHEIVDMHSLPVKQIYPHEGWVEQDANEILRQVLKTTKTLISRNEVVKNELLGIGITNQRESIVAWNRETGDPICNAIIWQDRRTSTKISSLPKQTKDLIKEKTGLLANPYFSASKMQWIMENVSCAKTLAKQHKLCFGTIDSFLAFKLTGNFVTDTTNASRTMLMDLKTLNWDEDLLKIFKIPAHALPEIKASDANFGIAKKLLGAPICAMIGDQMLSMYGQGATFYGSTKVTFGTGAFILCNIGKNLTKSPGSLVTTVAGTVGGTTTYAIEGSIYSACSAINFAKNNLDLYQDVSETANMANSLPDNEGVYFVPAFTGLGAPYWDDNARGMICGINFDTKQSHIVRAVLESMVYNTKAIFDEFKACGQKIKMISVDGGASKNEFVLQFLADMLAHNVVKSKNSESTVLGAIYIAMLSLKIISQKDIETLTKSAKVYKPELKDSLRKQYYAGWNEAVKKCLGGATTK